MCWRYHRQGQNNCYLSDSQEAIIDAMDSTVPHDYYAYGGARHTLSIVTRFRCQNIQNANSWLYDSKAVTALESLLPSPPKSIDSSCGEQAFLALFPRMSDSAMLPFGDTFKKGWLNRRDMTKMLRAAGTVFEVVPGELPTLGLALIEWTGAWDTESFWGSDLRHTHWVAVVDGFVFDVNWSGWLPRNIWEEAVLDDMISGMKGATGWRPHTGYEILSYR